MATVNDILRATLKGLIHGADVFNNVFHYVVITGTENDYTVIATAISAALDTAFSGLEVAISSGVQSDGLDLFEWDFTNNEWDGKAGVVSSALIGIQAAEMLPNGDSIVLRFVTEELRRQGRKFIPGLTEFDCNKNDLSTAIIATALVSANLLNNDIIAGGGHYSSVHVQ